MNLGFYPFTPLHSHRWETKGYSRTKYPKSGFYLHLQCSGCEEKKIKFSKERNISEEAFCFLYGLPMRKSQWRQDLDRALAATNVPPPSPKKGRSIYGRK